MRIAKRNWQWLFLSLVLLGIGFRIAGLGDRVFWVDEVATAIRIAGYTRPQLMALLTDASPLSPAQLQQFLVLDPNTPWSQTLAALSHSPEHAPLYFLLARTWSQVWGSSVVALRSLSVLLSLLAIGCMGWLAHRLYAGTHAAWTAAALLSLSPFFVAYAQEARPYSLWSLTLLLSGLLLLEAVRFPARWRWVAYGLGLSLTLYTSLLSVMVMAGQALYVVSLGGRSRIRGLELALVIAGVSFIPWLVVMVSHWGKLEDNTVWMREPLHGLVLLLVWLYSLVIVFFDAPVVASVSVVTVAKSLTALLVLAILSITLHWTVRRADPLAGRLVLALVLPVPLALIAIDILRQGQASATPRYFVPVQLGVLLAVVGWWALARSPLRFKSIILTFLLSLSLFSCISNLDRTPDYQKARNRHNQGIAAVIHQYSSPLLFAEPNRTLDIISLSQDLDEQASVQISSQMPESFPRCKEVLLFHPSSALQRQLQQNPDFKATQIFQPPLLMATEVHLSLWQVQHLGASCK